jgi:predicted metalloprotease
MMLDVTFRNNFIYLCGLSNYYNPKHTTMRWQGRQGSDNVEDQRGGRNVRRGAAGLGIGTIIIVVLGLLTGENPMQIFQKVQQQQQAQQPTAQSSDYQPSEAEQELAQFVSVVLKDTEDVWNKLFPEQVGEAYQEPKLVLFTGQVESACGVAGSSTGPFYCPGDQKVYIDLSFYNDMKNKLGAGGDFAMAYVIAHEVGHHIQYLLGTTSEMNQKRRQLDEVAFNKESVKLELQADFLAGVWAHHAQKMKGMMESGDLEEAMNAANAIGDDRLQKRGQGYIVPDAFTHGTSEQRMRWFKKGFETGDLRQGNTFTARTL